MTEKKHIVTIAGKPGSGKSTTANLVAQTLGFRRFSSGDFMREMAKERGMTLAELQQIAEGDRSIDDSIDGKLRDIGATETSLVIDSRLAHHWIPRAFKVYLDLDLETAARRIFAHQAEMRAKMGEGVGTFEEFHHSLIARFASEQKRYEALYQINPNEPSPYDLVVDTATNQPEVVAKRIVDSYRNWLSR